MNTLRLILGDQLNYNHSWYAEATADVVYFMAETIEEGSYVKHHIQKLVGFFKAMRSFSEHLKSKGIKLIYYTIDDTENKQSLELNLAWVIKTYHIQKFEYQLPDEYRLDKKLRSFCRKLTIPVCTYDTEHFYTKRGDVELFFKGKKGMVLEYFYRDMRKKHNILMLNDKQPEGGQWNFDKSNRKVWKGQPSVPKATIFQHNVEELVNKIDEQGIEHIGRIDSQNFEWPINRKECFEVLTHFCENLLPHFGDFEDAMHTEQKMLFH